MSGVLATSALYGGYIDHASGEVLSLCVMVISPLRLQVYLVERCLNTVYKEILLYRSTHIDIISCFREDIFCCQ